MLYIPQRPDLRRQPRIKGPDLPELAALREQARALGADDTLLYTDGGNVLNALHGISAVVALADETGRVIALARSRLAGC